MRYTTFTERGNRSDNEDYRQVVVNNNEGRHLFVVCDGMGGHAMGEVASRVVGTSICEYWNHASFAGKSRHSQPCGDGNYNGARRHLWVAVDHCPCR